MFFVFPKMIFRYNQIMETKKIGDWGEVLAEKYLKNKGFDILEKNFQNPSGKRLGEIDIIAFDKKEKNLVFVEVKTRRIRNQQVSLPEENITRQKLRKLNKIASFYLLKNNLQGHPFRFDGLAIQIDSDKKIAKIKHIPNIFL